MQEFPTSERNIYELFTASNYQNRPYGGYQLDFISFPFAPFDSLKIAFWERLGVLFTFSNRSSKITKSFFI